MEFEAPKIVDGVPEAKKQTFDRHDSFYLLRAKSYSMNVAVHGEGMKFPCITENYS